jgi:hypothetical protein
MLKIIKERDQKYIDTVWICDDFSPEFGNDLEFVKTLGNLRYLNEEVRQMMRIDSKVEFSVLFEGRESKAVK